MLGVWCVVVCTSVAGRRSCIVACHAPQARRAGEADRGDAPFGRQVRADRDCYRPVMQGGLFLARLKEETDVSSSMKPKSFASQERLWARRVQDVRASALRWAVSQLLVHRCPGKMIDPPPHWAASIGATPLRADSAAHPSAPRAGGALKEPPHAKSWEWEMQTAFKQVHAPPTTASDDNIVVHKGGCHCGAVRFEVDAPAHIVAWDCNVRAHAHQP